MWLGLIAGGGVLTALWHLTRIILATGLVSVVLGIIYQDYHRIEDAFEWALSLMLQFDFLLIAVVWWRVHFRSDLKAS